MTFYDALPGFLKESIKALAFHLPVSHRYLSLDFKLKQFLKGVGVSSEVRFFCGGAHSVTPREASC